MFSRQYDWTNNGVGQLLVLWRASISYSRSLQSEDGQFVQGVPNYVNSNETRKYRKAKTTLCSKGMSENSVSYYTRMNVLDSIGFDPVSLLVFQ